MRRFLLILLVCAGPCLHTAESLVVVVHGQVVTGELTLTRARDLLLGRVNTWPSGEAVVIVLCTDGSGERAVNRICSRSAVQLQRSWKRLVFAGTGAMPLMADTQQAAVALVERTPGAIMVLTEAPPAGMFQVIPLQLPSSGMEP